MMGVDVNYFGIIASGIFMMILGYAWYGPLFGKPWMKMVGLKKEDMSGMNGAQMAKTYGLMFVSSLVMAYVFAYILGVFQVETIFTAVTAAFWTWLGFIATTMFSGILWLKKPMNLFVIDAGYYLAGLIGIGIILTLWM